jgi:AcrR family transcriptional regulator
MASVKGTHRTYRSPLREEAARRTREAVVEAAAKVFVEVGYAGATIEQIAARAGVSRPTVFGVGSKAQLFALARMRAATGGPLTANDEGFRQILAIPDGRRLLEEFAAFTAAISQRLGPLQLVLEQAAGTDPELALLLESSQQELLECARGIVAATAATGSLRRDVPAEAAADMLWMQIQPTNYRRLVQERGWSHHAFERWHAAAMIAALLEPSGPADPETRTEKTSALLAAPVQPAGHRECVAAVGGAEFSRRPLQLAADDLQFVAGEAVPGPPNGTGPVITVQMAAAEGIGTCQENISVCRVEIPASRSSRSRSPGVARLVR